jgi:hypothetical protein
MLRAFRTVLKTASIVELQQDAPYADIQIAKGRKFKNPQWKQAGQAAE